MDEHLLTVAQAAESAKVSERTVYRWLDQGLRGLQPAGPKTVIRIAESDLRDFLGRDSRSRYLAVIRAAKRGARHAPPREAKASPKPA